MASVQKAVRTAYEAVVRLADVQPGETVMIVADESGWEENGDVIDAIFGVVRQRRAVPTLVTMRDVEAGGAQGYLPDAVSESMESADVVIGVTKTTAAPVLHHPLPERLRDEGKIRVVALIKRSFEALTSPTALEPDRERILETGQEIRGLWNEGKEIHVTSEVGTDFTARIDEHEALNTGYAHEPGDWTTVTWGEVVQGPTIGTTEGVAVIDGPVLEYGTPSSPIAVHMEQGTIVDITGDDPIVDELLADLEEHENAENVGEIAVGLNPVAKASPSQDPNIRKKALGSAHIAMGDGQFYDQSVASDVHIDLVMNTPTVEVDGRTVFDEGEYVLDNALVTSA